MFEEFSFMENFTTAGLRVPRAWHHETLGAEDVIHSTTSVCASVPGGLQLQQSPSQLLRAPVVATLCHRYWDTCRRTHGLFHITVHCVKTWDLLPPHVFQLAINAVCRWLQDSLRSVVCTDCFESCACSHVAFACIPMESRAVSHLLVSWDISA